MSNYFSEKAFFWQCIESTSAKTCIATHITEDEIRACFLTVFNSLMENRDALIEDCRLAQTVLCDTAAIDA